MRIGVGKPAADSPLDLKDYVLQEFSTDESKTLMGVFDKAILATVALLKGDLTGAQAIVSRFDPLPKID